MQWLLPCPSKTIGYCELCTFPAYFCLAGAGARVCGLAHPYFQGEVDGRTQISSRRDPTMGMFAYLRCCPWSSFLRCVCQLFFFFLSLDIFLTFPYHMIPLLVLILSHFYVIKSDEASGPNTHNENRELFLIPGMPMVNNTAQLLEWTASYINGFQSFWCDALF